MNIVVCAIAKNENKYINEGANHYLKLGFSHIYLYDNNSKNDPYIGDFIDQNILDKITIIDGRGISKVSLQLKAYQDCYDHNTFDWCLFCDIDEFITGTNDINQTLSNPALSDKEQIKVKIMLFGDDNILERDETLPVYEFFKQPINNKTERLPSMVKCFIRGGIKNVKINCCHIAEYSNHMPLITCTPNGIICKNGARDMHIDPPDSYENETLFLNHYITKTLKEFLEQKYGLHWVLMPALTRGIEYYGYYNDKTPEKIEYFNNYLKEHNLPLIDNGKKFC